MAEPVIHVIDDDDAMRDSLDYMLEAALMAVKTYGSADEFLAQLGSLETGCIVTDVRMPGASGLELIRVLAERAVPDPVIVITGHATVDSAVAALRAGASDYLVKPAALERVQAVLRHAKKTSALQHEIGELRDERRRLGRFGRILGRAQRMQVL